MTQEKIEKAMQSHADAPSTVEAGRERIRGIRRAQEIVARHSRKDSDPVADLIAERRKEAERE